ncbi:nucleotidyltransferase family protein [Geomonas anaerohicana]|uniref:Nucleotidyltransferase family protein n=1 Tax=Geomonas anaerohicana TaxID=2798583 RepID=A0ABS0YDP0_9BACT|nr:nucleotidyltransferase family protein [Geomonas anaerohicana]MBJ6750397.1 nucleotidyltransferase family protein [Geomonas anaerohicana]
MDFRAVTRKLVAEFSQQGIAYGLIGGYAVGLWGVPRGTVDMDFLVRLVDLPKVQRIMESTGYEVRFSSENVTQYQSKDGIFGEIDFLHAFRAASLAMLQRTATKSLFQEGVSIQVLIPEDLIGLKVQAFANDGTREALDMYDIETLMKIHHATMDWELVGSYFEVFDNLPLFESLKRKYHAAE